MKHIRGQAALEFLTTYGWAFLVILVMIGALAYFGVLNPSNFLPEHCTFPTELACRDSQVTKSPSSGNTATVNVYFSNNLGQGISGLALQAKYIDDPNTVLSDITLSPLCNLPAGSSYTEGQSIQASCTVVRPGGLMYSSVGSRVKFLVNGSYQPSNGIYMKTFSGEVYAKLN
jgi:hypothetical protein